MNEKNKKGIENKIKQSDTFIAHISDTHITPYSISHFKTVIDTIRKVLGVKNIIHSGDVSEKILTEDKVNSANEIFNTLAEISNTKYVEHASHYTDEQLMREIKRMRKYEKQYIKNAEIINRKTREILLDGGNYLITPGNWDIFLKKFHKENAITVGTGKLDDITFKFAGGGGPVHGDMIQRLVEPANNRINKIIEEYIIKGDKDDFQTFVTHGVSNGFNIQEQMLSEIIENSKGRIHKIHGHYHDKQETKIEDKYIQETIRSNPGSAGIDHNWNNPSFNIYRYSNRNGRKEISEIREYEVFDVKKGASGTKLKKIIKINADGTTKTISKNEIISDLNNFKEEELKLENDYKIENNINKIRLDFKNLSSEDIIEQVMFNKNVILPNSATRNKFSTLLKELNSEIFDIKTNKLKKSKDEIIDLIQDKLFEELVGKILKKEIKDIKGYKKLKEEIFKRKKIFSKDSLRKLINLEKITEGSKESIEKHVKQWLGQIGNSIAQQMVDSNLKLYELNKKQKDNLTIEQLRNILIDYTPMDYKLKENISKNVLYNIVDSIIFNKENQTRLVTKDVMEQLREFFVKTNGFDKKKSLERMKKITDNEVFKEMSHNLEDITKSLDREEILKKIKNNEFIVTKSLDEEEYIVHELDEGEGYRASYRINKNDFKKYNFKVESVGEFRKIKEKTKLDYFRKGFRDEKYLTQRIRNGYLEYVNIEKGEIYSISLDKLSKEDRLLSKQTIENYRKKQEDKYRDEELLKLNNNNSNSENNKGINDNVLRFMDDYKKNIDIGFKDYKKKVDENISENEFIEKAFKNNDPNIKEYLKKGWNPDKYGMSFDDATNVFKTNLENIAKQNYN